VFLCTVGRFAAKKFILRWVLHPVKSDQEAERFALSSELVEVLMSRRRKEFDQITTGDEFLFDFGYLHSGVWARSREEVPERIKQKMDTEKCGISIIWFVNRIHSLFDVPKDIAYNSTFFYDSVVSDLVESICSHSRRKTLKDIMVYLNNGYPHNSKKSTECLEQFRIRRVPHPDHGTDLAPNDFFFKYVKS
jgi:hypothetical protein